MRFMEKLRGELIDVIEWVDDSRHTLVWRFPRFHNQIKHGAQLIVRPGQSAIFVREGRIADVFGPGRGKVFEPPVGFVNNKGTDKFAVIDVFYDVSLKGHAADDFL